MHCLVRFDTCINIWNHHHNQENKHMHHLQTFLHISWYCFAHTLPSAYNIQILVLTGWIPDLEALAYSSLIQNAILN